MLSQRNLNVHRFQVSVRCVARVVEAPTISILITWTCRAWVKNHGKRYPMGLIVNTGLPTAEEFRKKRSSFFCLTPGTRNLNIAVNGYGKRYIMLRFMGNYITFFQDSKRFFYENHSSPPPFPKNVEICYTFNLAQFAKNDFHRQN
jgi:hypothetical protein